MLKAKCPFSLRGNPRCSGGARRAGNGDLCCGLLDGEPHASALVGRTPVCRSSAAHNGPIVLSRVFDAFTRGLTALRPALSSNRKRQAAGTQAPNNYLITAQKASRSRTERPVLWLQVQSANSRRTSNLWASHWGTRPALHPAPTKRNTVFFPYTKGYEDR